VRTAAKERGFRTEQAFILASCENELKRDGTTEPTTQLEARIIVRIQKVAKEFQAVFTLAHCQFALTNSLLQYVLTFMIDSRRGAAGCSCTGETQICKDRLGGIFLQNRPGVLVLAYARKF